ncbi:hypothetical protein BDR05DRAFT_967506 [Suillus weaverae]|nr:hypothetical protein BDR05DRAFT_967506 [Suillus weaverae]
MHICFLATEIILHIISHIYRDHNGRAKRVTLAALARTCRKFKEPALDSLWKDISGFKPLISCLPEGVSSTNVQGGVTFNRPLSNSEWRLLDRYARRIHSFTVSTYNLDALNDRVVQALISAPSVTPLLSNLRNLVWCDNQEHFFPLLRTLFGSTITSMKLGSRSSPPTFASSALLASLGARCPSIRELDCTCCGDSEESSDVIVEALCGLQKLFHLETGVLHTRDFVRMASLPSLKCMHFDLMKYDINETQLNSIPVNFSQLDEVRITSPSPSILYHCLKNIRCLSCQSLKIAINCDPFDDTSTAQSQLYRLFKLEIADLISLSECFSPALEGLIFELAYEFDDFNDEDTLANRRFALGFDVIAPLLSFSRLTDFRLDWICTSAIDDTSLKTLAQSWPQLEIFYFGGSVPWLIPPSLTSIGFIHLIHHCPRLRSIQMSFCACPVDINDETFSKIIPNENITIFSVGMSPIVDPIDVAHQLRGLLPKLTEVCFLEWRADEFGVPLAFEDYEDGWGRVNEFLGVSLRPERK